MYGTAALLLLVVILGGSVTKPVFNNYSVKTLESAGVKKASIDSLDSRIDDMLFAVKKVQMQIDKLKNIFSDKEIDESNYQRVKNEVFVKNIYSPLIELVIVFYRIGFFFLSIIIFLAAIIFHLAYRSKDLRRRIEKLESVIYSG